MPDIDIRTIASIARINRAKEMADAAGEDYYNACEDYDWDAAEEARERMLGHLEAFMDQIAATYRLLEATSARKKR